MQRDLVKQAEQTEPVMEQAWGKIKNFSRRTKERTLKTADTVLIQWGGLLFILGILLGRAVLLAELFPFALPFFAAVYAWRKDKSSIAAAGIVVGTFSGAIFHGAFILAAIALFLALYKWLTSWVRGMTWVLPIAVFLSTAGARAGTTWLESGSISSYSLVMTGVEAGLSFILTMIFLQSMPLLVTKKRRKALKHEEIICFIILLSSVMTGAIGWVFYGVAAEHTLARYLVLLFAYTGGAALGASVGVIVGLVLSLASVANLYQMSLLAFAGLLGGLLKEGKKVGVSIGLLLGTALIALYGDGMKGVNLTLLESGAAIVLFYLTPRVVTAFIEKYIPGTPEYAREQQRHANKLRDLTAVKVEQFSHLFQTLSTSFLTQTVGEEAEEREQKDKDELLSKVTEKTCQTCFRKESCWVKQFHKTYDGMSNMLTELENHGSIPMRTKGQWKKHCHYHKRMEEVMGEEVRQDQARRTLKKQMKESRQLVADQLRGVSEVMNDFAKEIQKEQEAHHGQEEQIYEALQGAGLDIGHVDIYCLDEGNVEIEMSVGKEGGTEQADKIIAPMLSDILEEHIIVKEEEAYDNISDYLNFSFISARPFTVETGFTSVAKEGRLVSGDSHAALDVGTGKFAIAISDGMGSGEKAHQESSSALQILQTILASGMDEATAIRSINSIMSLRSAEETFSTLDLAMIDLQNASGKFIKIGSVPSFIKRGEKIKQIEAGNLPIGMMEHAELEVVTEKLQDGDMIIMMSDGLLEVPGPIENMEMWIKRMIAQLETDDPQEAADLLLERVMKVTHGQIHDDMTVMAAKIKRNTPKWAAIPVGHSIPLKKKQA
ncbi:stage II sporulation protein E [Bacillus piscicola]|uniref:stage II sporulation protein E n=1 Tax=Bacillus piscicola TaxID=1632684 RepID=UPI001F08FFFC|nr:stage II sporulation protein E [Bacillus piscicola]